MQFMIKVERENLDDRIIILASQRPMQHTVDVYPRVKMENNNMNPPFEVQTSLEDKEVLFVQLLTRNHNDHHAINVLSLSPQGIYSTMCSLFTRSTERTNVSGSSQGVVCRRRVSNC